MDNAIVALKTEGFKSFEKEMRLSSKRGHFFLPPFL